MNPVAAERASLGPAGNGGGLIRISAQSLTLNGSILANGDGRWLLRLREAEVEEVIRVDVGTLTGTGQISCQRQDGKGPS